VQAIYGRSPVRALPPPGELERALQELVGNLVVAVAQDAEDRVRVGGVPQPRGGRHLRVPAAGPRGLARGQFERVDEVVRGPRHEVDDGARPRPRGRDPRRTYRRRA
jgi:hypothetical protein